MLRKTELNAGPMGHYGLYKGFAYFEELHHTGCTVNYLILRKSAESAMVSTIAITCGYFTFGIVLLMLLLLLLLHNLFALF